MLLLLYSNAQSVNSAESAHGTLLGAADQLIHGAGNRLWILHHHRQHHSVDRSMHSLEKYAAPGAVQHHSSTAARLLHSLLRADAKEEPVNQCNCYHRLKLRTACYLRYSLLHYVRKVMR